MDVFDLFAKISLDTGDYENGLDRAGKDANRFGETLKGLSGGIGSLAKAVDEGFQAVERAGDAADGLAGALSGIVTGGLALLAGKTPEFAQAGSEFAEALAAGLMDASPEALASTGRVMDALLESVSAFPDDHAGELTEVGTETAALIFDGLSRSGGLIAEGVGEWVPLIADGLLSRREGLFSAGAEIPDAVGKGMTENLPALAESALRVITTLADGLSRAVPELRPAAAGIVPEIAGILTDPDTLGVLPDAASRIIGNLAEAFTEAVPDLQDQTGEVGAAVVEGIWQGIQSSAGQFGENVKDFLGGIVDGVKDVLGIHSPSRVFAGIGENMAAGLGEGWESEFGRIRSQIEDGMDFGTASVELEGRASRGPAYGGAGGPVNTNQQHDIVINLTAELDGAAVARKMVRHNARANSLVGASLVDVSRQ